MTAILIGILSQFWPYLLAALGGLALIFQQRRAGAKAEQAKQAQREAKAREIADEVDQQVNSLPTKTAREELSKWSR